MENRNMITDPREALLPLGVGARGNLPAGRRSPDRSARGEINLKVVVPLLSRQGETNMIISVTAHRFVGR